MIVIIAGSRTIRNYAAVERAVQESNFLITEVICGGARGVDQMGKLWAERHNKSIIEMPADWERYGRAAGPIRNEVMARAADALVLVWTGESAGSANMKSCMMLLGKPIFESLVEPTPTRSVHHSELPGSVKRES